MSKRRVLADHDTASRDSPSPSPGPRVLGFRPTSTTTPRGRGGSMMATATPGSAGALSPSIAGSGRAKVDLSTMAFADATSSASPSLRRAPASSPYVASTASLSSSTSSPALRGVAMTSSSSAPTTPRIGPPQTQPPSTSSSSSVRSPSPNKQLRQSSFERGEIPPTVTVRSASKMSASLRARAGALDGGSGGMTSSASMTSGLASPPVSSSGRISPVRVAGHARSNTLGRVPTAASLHATPTQARMAASTVFSPPATASPISPSLPRPRSFVAPRPGSPSRPASPPLASQGGLHARHSASEGQEASKRLSRPPLAPGYHQKQHSMSSSSVSGLSSTQSAYSMAAPRSSIGSDLTNGSRSPVSPSPAAGPSSPPRSPGMAKVARPQQQQTTTSFGSHANVREQQPSFGSAAATAQAVPPPASNGFFDWAFSATSPPAHSPTRPTLATAPTSSSASSSTASQGAPPLISPTSHEFPATTAAAAPPLSSSASTSQHLSLPIEYAQLRKERKIADLEITNKSLMAINSGLEVAKHRQAREIRELKRRLAVRVGSVDGGSTTSSSGMRSPGTDGEEYDEEEEDDDEYFPAMGDDLGPPKENPELEAAHQRCRAMIDGMIAEARGALLSVWPPLASSSLAVGGSKGLAANGNASSSAVGGDLKGIGGGGGGMKVLSLGEVHEREEEAARAEEEEDGEEVDARGIGEDSLDARPSADTSFLTETASPALTRQPSSSQLEVSANAHEPLHDGETSSSSTPAEWTAAHFSSSLRPGNDSAMTADVDSKAQLLSTSSSIAPAQKPSLATALPTAAAVDNAAHDRAASLDGVNPHSQQQQAEQAALGGIEAPPDGRAVNREVVEPPSQTATPRLGDTATLAAAAEASTAPATMASVGMAHESQPLPDAQPAVPASGAHGEAASGGDEDDADQQGGATPSMGGKGWLASEAVATTATSTPRLDAVEYDDAEDGDEKGDTSGRGSDTSASYDEDDDDDEEGEGSEGFTVTPDISID